MIAQDQSWKKALVFLLSFFWLRRAAQTRLLLTLGYHKILIEIISQRCTSTFKTQTPFFSWESLGRRNFHRQIWGRKSFNRIEYDKLIFFKTLRRFQDWYGIVYTVETIPKMRNPPLPKISTFSPNKHISHNKHLFWPHENVLIMSGHCLFKSFTCPNSHIFVKYEIWPIYFC